MNILTVTNDFSLFRFRPDSTLIRSQDFYYMPDYVISLSFAPIVYFRCSRPGKAVAEQFAHRYIDSFGYGLLLYPELSEELEGYTGSVESAMDFTTFIPNHVHPMSDYGAFPSFKPLRMALNGHTVCETPRHPSYDEIRGIISGITRFSSIRTGDFMAYELTRRTAAAPPDRITLWTGEEQLISLSVR